MMCQPCEILPSPLAEPSRFGKRPRRNKAGSRPSCRRGGSSLPVMPCAGGRQALVTSPLEGATSARPALVRPPASAPAPQQTSSKAAVLGLPPPPGLPPPAPCSRLPRVQSRGPIAYLRRRKELEVEENCAAWAIRHDIGVPAILRGDVEKAVAAREADACELARRRRSHVRVLSAEAREHARRWERRNRRPRKGSIGTGEPTGDFDRRTGQPTLGGSTIPTDFEFDENDEEELQGDEPTQDTDLTEEEAQLQVLPVHSGMPTPQSASSGPTLQQGQSALASLRVRLEQRRRKTKMRQDSELTEEEAQLQVLPVDSGSPTPQSASSDPTLQQRQSARTSVRVQRLEQRRRKTKMRQESFNSIMSETERDVVVAVYKLFADPPGNGLDETALGGCLEAVGLSGLDPAEREAVAESIAAEVAESERVSLHDLGFLLPQIRDAFRQLLRLQAMELFKRHVEAPPGKAAVGGDSGVLRATECIWVLDRHLASIAPPACDEDAKQVLESLQGHIEDAEPSSEMVDVERFVVLAQLVREAAARTTYERLQSTLQEGSFSLKKGEDAEEEEDEEEEECYRARLPRPETSFEELAVVLGSFCRSTTDEPGRLSRGELLCLMTELGVRPIRRRDPRSLPALEGISWNCCQDILEVRAAGKELFEFDECLSHIDGVRKMIRHRAAIYLRRELNLDHATALKVPAAQALVLLNVASRTASERRSIDHELRASSDGSGFLPIQSMADFAARSLELILRRRRAAERRLADALDIGDRVEQLQEAFAEELAMTRSKEEITPANEPNQQSPSSLISPASRNMTAAEVAMGDGATLTASSLGSLLTRLNLDLSPLAVAELAAAATGSARVADGLCVNVDFAAALLVTRLAEDGHGYQAYRGRPPSRDPALTNNAAIGPSRRQAESFAWRHGRVRLVLAALGMAGPLVVALPLEDREMLAERALMRSGGGKSSAARDLEAVGRMKGPSSEPTLELVRHARAWAFEQCV
eukprot:TRINITY_DN34886_c0_g1_i5.p1 TRINITY_DN34886_c0_g1~~TRINITY_DN34886_c0_g1_i5.p1  ORF type:complete len:991 (-),score=181.28 TRINITY_DN34886_c0_g1_i5:14-2986(-)